jgi:large subunit ribosomal protein L28
MGISGSIGYPVERLRDRAIESCVPHPVLIEGVPVAANCDVCGKSPGFGHSISHSHRRTKRRWDPNIQKVRALVGKSPKRINVCTSCLKAGKVKRAV